MFIPSLPMQTLEDYNYVQDLKTKRVNNILSEYKRIDRIKDIDLYDHAMEILIFRARHGMLLCNAHGSPNNFHG